MKISLNWLRDYVDFDLTAEQIGAILSDRGLPYEEIIRTESDAVIDVEVTSNRGDCLSYIGIAREIAAATGKQLKLPEVKLPESKSTASQLVKVEVAEPTLCGRYTARVIENVKVGPTPAWMRTRLEAIGLRSVNNVVDATNYAMMETGQPPHAFDFAKIEGAKIVVRKAVAGERIVSIDGSKCDLNTSMLVITDGRGPVAIAGVMGGLDTEVSDATTTILLEDAHFAPVAVRATGRKLGIKSDAAYRFERNVDIEMIDWASQRTAQLITMVAGGNVAVGVVDAYPQKAPYKVVSMRMSRLKQLLGIEVETQKVVEILSGLDFKPVVSTDSGTAKTVKILAGVNSHAAASADDMLVCTVPSWRSDVYREVDVIEEFARCYGYDKIQTRKSICIEVAPVDAKQKFMNMVRGLLNGAGYFETINVTFIDDVAGPLFSGMSKEQHLGVTDVSRKSANLLRQNLLGSIAQCLKTNYNARNSNVRLYEIADTFKPGDGRTQERMKVGLMTDGDFRELRGVIEVILRQIDRDVAVDFVSANVVWASTGAQITANGKVIGEAGIVSKAVLEKMDIKGATPSGAELDLEMLMELQSGPKKIRQIPRFPAIDRDLSIIIDEPIAWAQIVPVVKASAPEQLENIGFTGIYRGKPIPEGKKSLTLTLRFRDEDGTLTHETVDAFQNSIVAQLNSQLGAELRTA